MKIKSVSAVNFKGRSFKNELAPITVLVGQNFSGKSSRTEAMTLALAGYIPGIEKKPGSIHERLASGNPMGVKVDFDEGKFISREYNQTAKGVRCTVSHRGLSDSFAVDPVLIDANEFLGLSAKERVKFLFQRLTLTGEVVTPASLIAKVDTAKMDYAERSKEVLAAIETEITADHEQAVTNGLPPQAWLESLAVTFNQRLLDARQRYKVLLDAQQGMAGSSVEGSVNSAAIKERLTKAQAAVKAAREALQTAQSALNEDRRVKAVAFAKHTAAVTQARERWQAADAALVAARQELAEVEEIKCCPTCQAKNKGWRNKIFKLAETKVKEAVEQESSTKEALRNVEHSVNVERDENEINVLQMRPAETRRTGRVPGLSRGGDEAVSENSPINAGATDENERAGLRPRLSGQGEDSASAVLVRSKGGNAPRGLQQAAGSDVALPEASPTTSSDELAENVSKLRCDVNVAETELQAAQAEHDKVVAREAEEAQRQAAAKKMVTAMIEGTVLKEFSKVITESLDSLITSSIEPFVAKINSLCEGILTMPIGYQNGELGMVNTAGSLFYSWRAFSGTEKLLFLAGVSMALAEQSQLKICVLDEIGKLDDENKEKLLLRLVQLIETGTIEQAILIEAGDTKSFWENAPLNCSPKECRNDNTSILAVVEVQK